MKKCEHEFETIEIVLDPYESYKKLEYYKCKKCNQKMTLIKNKKSKMKI